MGCWIPGPWIATSGQLKPEAEKLQKEQLKKPTNRRGAKKK